MLRTHRPTIVQPEPLTVIGGDGGDGGDGGGGGGDGDGGGGGGGDGGDGGDGGGGGGDGFTTKDTVSCRTCRGEYPKPGYAKEKVCPKLGAAHCAPFQPSPYESLMVRAHVAPIVTAKGELDV